MAEFSKLVITDKGQALLAKMIAGNGNIEFTKISTSSATYTDAQLEELASLSNVMQTSLISNVTRINEVAIKVEAAFTNAELTEGYYMKVLGLYAVDPDVGEILYAVTRETSGNCYMPAYNGITVSGAYVKLVTTVGNAENVSLEVDSGAYATIGDIKALKESFYDLLNYNNLSNKPRYVTDIFFSGIKYSVSYSDGTRKEGELNLNIGTSTGMLTRVAGNSEIYYYITIGESLVIGKEYQITRSPDYTTQVTVRDTDGKQHTVEGDIYIGEKLAPPKFVIKNGSGASATITVEVANCTAKDMWIPKTFNFTYDGEFIVVTDIAY